MSENTQGRRSMQISRNMENVYEQFLRAWDSRSPGKEALIHVADMAYACQLWLESYCKGDAFTTADILRMTELVLEHERELKVEDSLEGTD